MIDSSNKVKHTKTFESVKKSKHSYILYKIKQQKFILEYES